MTLLTPAEGLKLMAHGMLTMGIIADYPKDKEEWKLWDAHYASEDKKKEEDPKYLGKPWFRDGKGPQPTQEEIEKDSTEFIAKLIAARPKDFNYMNEVNNFDIMDNFKKQLAEIVDDVEKTGG